MSTSSVRIDECSRRERINQSILSANAKEHQFGVVGKLHAEPIPADLVAFELVREKFVIHPRQTADLDGFATQRDRSVCRKPRERNVVRRVPRAGGFLAYAIFALNHGRFFRFQGELQIETWIDRLKRLLVAVPLDLPVAVPDARVLGAYPGDAGAGSIRALGVVEMPAVEIAEREVCEIKIAHVPRALLCFPVCALAKKCELETESVTVGRCDVARVIPPLGLIFGMVEVVARKFIEVAR